MQEAYGAAYSARIQWHSPLVGQDLPAPEFEHGPAAALDRVLDGLVKTAQGAQARGGFQGVE